jgi:hypothetical protein
VRFASPSHKPLSCSDKMHQRPRCLIWAGVYCVKLARQTDDWETRVILREMAAEWLRLVDAADH